MISTLKWWFSMVMSNYPRNITTGNLGLTLDRFNFFGSHLGVSPKLRSFFGHWGDGIVGTLYCFPRWQLLGRIVQLSTRIVIYFDHMSAKNSTHRPFSKWVGILLYTLGNQTWLAGKSPHLQIICPFKMPFFRPFPRGPPIQHQVASSGMSRSYDPLKWLNMDEKWMNRWLVKWLND